MNELQMFNNSEFGNIRGVVYEGKPYAIGVDVARALEYVKPSQAVIDHCKGIRKLGIPSNGGEQETNIIPEGDIYRLIVKAADQSKNPKIKEKADKFESWIFDTVLPSIRQQGVYMPEASDIQMLVSQTIEKTVNEVIRQLIPVVTAVITTSAHQLINDTTPKLPVKSGRYKKKAPSYIEKLDVGLRNEVEEMLCSGEYTYSEITKMLNECGVDISLTSVHRYAKSIFNQ